MAQQPYPGMGPGFPQQAVPGNPPGALLGSQPPPLASQPMGNASFVPTSAPEGVGPMDTAADGMMEGGFPGLEGEDMHGDLALAQSLPFSASEMNLANMVGIINLHYPHLIMRHAKSVERHVPCKIHPNSGAASCLESLVGTE